MIYFDNSATTQPRKEVREAVIHSMEDGWNNPSAIYKPSMEVQKAMENVRSVCLKAAHCRNGRVIFTSGGTEADNLAILGGLKGIRGGGKVLLSCLEHPAVLNCADEIRRMGFEVVIMPSDRNGLIDTDELEKMLSPEVRMIVLMQVNNEVGTIQPLERVMELKRKICPEAWVHVDGVQGFMRVPMDMDALKIDSYAFSGHKIHALKGTGALIIRGDKKISALLHGGGQEGDIRSGTENTPGIMALGAAVGAYDTEDNQKMRELKTRLWNGIKEMIPEALLNGLPPENEFSSPHILNVSFQPVRSQTMLFALEGDGIYVSAGSACASRKQKISPVLKAMGVNTERADSAIRFSLCPFNTAEEIDETVRTLDKHYQMLKKYVRR